MLEQERRPSPGLQRAIALWGSRRSGAPPCCCVDVPPARSIKSSVEFFCCVQAEAVHKALGRKNQPSSASFCLYPSALFLKRRRRPSPRRWRRRGCPRTTWRCSRWGLPHPTDSAGASLRTASAATAVCPPAGSAAATPACLHRPATCCPAPQINEAFASQFAYCVQVGRGCICCRRTRLPVNSHPPCGRTLCRPPGLNLYLPALSHPNRCRRWASTPRRSTPTEVGLPAWAAAPGRGACSLLCNHGALQLGPSVTPPLPALLHPCCSGAIALGHPIGELGCSLPALGLPWHQRRRACSASRAAAHRAPSPCPARGCRSGCSGARQTVTLMHEMQVGQLAWREVSFPRRATRRRMGNTLRAVPQAREPPQPCLAWAVALRPSSARRSASRAPLTAAPALWRGPPTAT